MDPYLRWLRSKIGTEPIKAPGAGVVVRDAAGRVLLGLRADNKLWGILGGWVSPGESVLEAAVREAREESGFEVVIGGLLGVYSAPELTRTLYPNGDRAEFVNVIFEGRLGSKVAERDAETLELRFFAPTDLPALHPSDRQPIADALSDGARPFVR